MEFDGSTLTNLNIPEGFNELDASLQLNNSKVYTNGTQKNKITGNSTVSGISTVGILTVGVTQTAGGVGIINHIPERCGSTLDLTNFITLCVSKWCQ